MATSPKATTLGDDKAALGATLGYGVDVLGDTEPTSAAPPPPTSRPQLNATLTATRTTVLPRRKRATGGEELQIEEKPRFEMLELIGRGGMGEVALVKDNDIRRTVAVKRLLAEHKSGDAMLRFADEVRAVGQLEHPGIVPIYDVGMDENGQHYLVMKHVQGETLETVIEKLREGDREHLRRFTYEYRAHVFLEILQAIRYAHDRGIIHRDIKPANVMIGPFGEVTVMDWGVAKRIERAKVDAPAEPLSLSTADGKLLETLHGSLVGTPLYMSPEQAAGKNEQLDERSDIYSLALLFYELLTLEHPHHRIKSLQELVATVIAKDHDFRAMQQRFLDLRAPVEYCQFLLRGLERDREKRFASVAEMEQKLRNVLAGNIPIYCPISLTKNVTHGFLHWIDRYPRIFLSMLTLGVLGFVGAIGWLVVLLVRR